MSHRRRTAAFLYVAVWLLRSASLGGEPSARLAPADNDSATQRFRTHVMPFLQQHCLQCHGELQQESGLRLDREADLRQGGDRGPGVVAGDPAASWLWRAVDPQDEELQMPPDRSDAEVSTEIAAIRQWIEQGAIWPPDLVQIPPPVATVTDEDRAFWSFQPPTAVAVPEFADDGWSRNDVDRFILAAQRSAGVRALPEAEPATLARRAYLDLIGLPPTPGELQQYLADTAPLAYERLVDRLLERPEYGQRWARHWLDLVRYAESDGFKADVYRPSAWHYRDYVVQALNDDKPYDRFLQEQLAGDEMFPDDRAARIATGYLRLWPLEDNQKDVQRQWTLVLQETTEITAEVMLGLGVRCARCHDHKYDPIPQRDYYRMQAFFAAMLPRNDLELAPEEQMGNLRAWERTTAAVRQQMAEVEARYIAARTSTIQAYPPYLQAIYRKPLAEWTALDRQYAYLARPQIDKRAAEELEFRGELRASWDALTAELAEHQDILPAERDTIMAVTDVGAESPPTYLADNPSLPECGPGFLSVLSGEGPSASDWDPAQYRNAVVADWPTTGRRTALALWLTQPRHPLTARVIVNRIWQQHFGRGIVGTPNDFGHQGERPTHPELLDYLAVRFTEDGWSLKRLHRLLMTSATYRQATLRAADDPDLAVRTYAGWLPRRLDGDQIRDAMLHVSGELQPYAPAEGAPPESLVRSIQLQQVRNRPDEWLNAFDGPDMFNSCARRYTTTTPLQSLLVMNSPWAAARASALAQRILEEQTPSVDGWMEQAYWRTLAREPDPEERRLVREFFRNAPPGDVERVTDFCHALLCSNEFIYVD